MKNKLRGTGEGGGGGEERVGGRGYGVARHRSWWTGRKADGVLPFVFLAFLVPVAYPSWRTGT